jgi:soluble lytic murein transglycosylase
METGSLPNDGSAKPMISRKRGVARLTVFLIAAAALTLLPLPLSFHDRPVLHAPQSDNADSVPQSLVDPSPHTFVKPTGAWRAKLGSLQDALRNFIAHRTAPMRQATRREFPLYGSIDESALSPLLAYARPTDSWFSESYLTGPSQLDATALLGDDQDGFMRALASYKAGSFAAGDFAVASIKSSAAVAAAQWVGLRLHPREAGLSRLARFLDNHPNWPAADWIRSRAEEALYGDKHPYKVAKEFFAHSKPLTPAGKLALARALLHDGDLEAAGLLVIETWREDDMNGALEKAILKEYGAFLTAPDHKYRADRLLYRGNNSAALRAAALAGKDVSLLARARIAANAKVANEKVFSTVPPNLQNDPGLLFARIHMLRLGKKIAEAGALMRKAPREAERVIDGNAWWTERRVLARELLDKGDPETAYVVCAQHSAHSTSSKVDAEFHAGWIALRFLNDAVRAERHFELLDQVAETPSQKSRAAYWRGRAAEFAGAAKDQEKARAFYERAAQHSTTFYGQLARLKIGVTETPLRRPPSPAEGDARDEAVRAVEVLFSVGEKDVAAGLAFGAARKLEGEAQLAALANVAARKRDAKISLIIGKLASNRGVAVDDAAFPAYGVPQFSVLPGSAPRSIVYAVARQESAFDPTAISRAGAMGLMQMIASTARRTAYLAGVGFDLRRMIAEPAFNAQLGAAHLGILLGEHRGSYILTFAAYNAGGGRVREWINAYGDPRKRNVDPIDWVERIPFTETRNYVQRVMENFVVYRAKFGDHGGKPPHVELANAGSQL